MSLEEFIQNENPTIIDVRSTIEFQGGHVAGSINIPVTELPGRVDEIKSLDTPVVLCCASGARSGMASQFLSQQGIECYNGGPWMNVNYFQSKKVI